MLHDKGNIIIFRPGAIGDTLVTIPVISAIRKNFPLAHIKYVGNRNTIPLLLACQIIDEGYSFDDLIWANLFNEADVKHQSQFAAYVSDCSLAIVWMSVYSKAFERNLLSNGVQKIIWAPGKPGEPTSKHISQFLADGLQSHLGILELDLQQSITLKNYNHLPFSATNTFIIHPGSGSKAKCWPAQNFASVIEFLLAHNIQPAITAGEADDWILQEMGSYISDRNIQVLKNMQLTDLAVMLEKCLGMLGNDSGISHLAGLAGCPTLALFGPTDPEIWKPCGPHVEVMRSPAHNMEGISPEAVIMKIRQMFKI